LEVVIAYSSGKMLQKVFTINGNEINCHSLKGRRTWELNATGIGGNQDEMIRVNIRNHLSSL
jgi:hypothetical protein